MKASMVAAALVGSVAASQHKAHADFHRRGEYKVDDVCSTVYHTVYVTASPMPSMAPNTTVVAKPSSTPCEEKKTSVYTPIVVSSTKEAYPPAPPKQESSKPPVYPVYTPAPSPSKPAASPSKPAEYPAVPASSKAVEYPVVPAPSKPAETQPKPVPSKQADKPKPGGSYSQSGRIVTKGDKWAMTYTPYATNGNCKTSSEIASDIKKIAELGFTTIRSYSTDCGVFESVVPECQKNGLKVIYGIFLEGAGKGPFSDYANQQLQEIKDKAPKDSVAMVIVGNECMFNNNCEATQLASYIDHVRKELQSCGFPSDVAVTTTEPVGTWEEKGAALCDHIDVFTVQVHPYFTSTVSADMAGDFALQQLAQAAKVCPGAASKGTYISEIGWPSAGDANGLAVPGVEQQKIAVKSIMEKVGSEACLFSFQDDAWKAPGSLNVEQHFGCTEALY